MGDILIIITQLKQDKSGRVSDAGSSTLAGAG